MYAKTAWSVLQEGNLLHHHPLPSLSPLDHPEDAEQSSSFISTIANFTSNGGLAWRAWGPTVEVLDPSSGVRKAAWTFGALLQNSGTKVTCACEVGIGTTSHMMVGLDLGPDKGSCGMVCLLSLQSSKIIRAIYLPYRVMSICMVTGGMYAVDVGTLAPELRSMKGIVAVGMAQGRVSLIDLVLDANGDIFLSDEVSPGSLMTQPVPDSHPEARRREAVSRKNHLELCLSDGMSSNGNFSLVGPDEHILFETAAHKVTVTALLYVPQIASLVVGYSFGAFQVYNLSKLAIECASPFEENMPPVLAFAYQEPENDPRNFVYLWLSRSWRMLDGNVSPDKKSMPALCTLYAMNYDKKEWIEGHGLWYQGLLSISPRFEFEALGGLGLEGRPTAPSVVFATSSVTQSTLTTGLPTTLTAPDEETSPVPELSLCVFGWTGGVLERGRIAIKNYFAVFDINQWYQAQMPFSLSLERDQLCPYMSLHMLDCDLVQNQGEIILSAAPKAATWDRHKSTMHNDKDWYPSSLSYDLRVITSSSILKFHCSSAQSSVLSCLVQGGPVAVVSPSQAYKLCVLAGLIPNDNGSPTTDKSLIKEREMVLKIALDHRLVCFLVNCVEEFAEGRFTHLGCSLSTLLDWAWLQVYNIKDSNDSLCAPLFDVDVGVVSQESICSLYQNLTLLSTIQSVITAIRNNAQAVTSRSADELDGKVMVVTLLHLHLQVVLWFYHCKLLPQREEENMLDDSDVPYPVSLLQKIYANRRAEIKSLSSSLDGTEILLIDGMLEDTHEAVGKLWSHEGGSVQYPPPSLHALLAMYLLPDVPTTTKHRIVQYLFLDLASLLSDGFVNVVEELVKFPSSFSLSPSLIKLSQAFWLIDHKDFQEGLNVLLDPLINSKDIALWQHRRIIKALLYQGEHSRALTYARIRRPPLADLDDIRLHLTLLLANGLTREAFHYQRTHRVQANTDDLLNHFFTGCEQMGKLQTVIQLPLNKLEEDSFIAYLRSSTKPSAIDLLIVYYLQRSRYVEVLELQNQLRSFGHIGTSRKRHGARTALVDGFLAQLPDESKKMAAGFRRSTNTHIYTKPQPLSAHIRQLKHERMSLSSQRQLGQGSSPIKQNLSAPFTPFRNRAQRRKYAGLDSEPDSAIDLLNRSGRGTKRDVSHIIFPKHLEFSASDSPQHEEAAVAPSAKRKKDWDSFLGQDSIRLAESLHEKCHRMSTLYMEDSHQEYSRSKCHNVSAEVLSLLQTPPVHKKLPSSQAGQAADMSMTDITTPQSILKVRKMLQRSRSPSVASEASTTSFPALRKHTIINEENVTADAAMTPKQLRFHLPVKEVNVKEVDVPEYRMEEGEEEEEEEEEEQEDVEKVNAEEEKDEEEEEEEEILEVSTTESEPEPEVLTDTEEHLITKTQEDTLKRTSRSPSPEEARLMGEEDNTEEVEETEVEGRAEVEEGEAEQSLEEKIESEADEEASEKSLPLEEDSPSNEVSCLTSANSSYQEMYYSFTEEETLTVTKKRTDIVEICLDSDDSDKEGVDEALDLNNEEPVDHESVCDDNKKEIEKELKVQEEAEEEKSEASVSTAVKDNENDLEKHEEDKKHDVEDIGKAKKVILEEESTNTIESEVLDMSSQSAEEFVASDGVEEETSSLFVLANDSDEAEAPSESESALPLECAGNEPENRNIVEVADDMITAAIEMIASAELPSNQDTLTGKENLEYSECFDLVFSDEELETCQEEAAETGGEKVEEDLLDVALQISKSPEKANNDKMDVEENHEAASEQKLNLNKTEQFEDLIFSDNEESSIEDSMVKQQKSKDLEGGEVVSGSETSLTHDTKDEEGDGEEKESVIKIDEPDSVVNLPREVEDDSEFMEPLVISDDENEEFKDDQVEETSLESQEQDLRNQNLEDVCLKGDTAVGRKDTPTMMNTNLEAKEMEKRESAGITTETVTCEDDSIKEKEKGITSGDAQEGRDSITNLLEKESSEVGGMEIEENISLKEDEMKGRESVDHKEVNVEEGSTFVTEDVVPEKDEMERKDIATKVRHVNIEEFEDKQSTVSVAESVSLKEEKIESLDSADITEQNASGRDSPSAETNALLEQKIDVSDKKEVVLTSGLGDVEDVFVPTSEAQVPTTEEKVVEGLEAEVAEKTSTSIKVLSSDKATAEGQSFALQEKLLSTPEIEGASIKLIKTGDEDKEKTASVKESAGKLVEDKSSDRKLRSPRKRPAETMKSLELGELKTGKFFKEDDPEAVIKELTIPVRKVDEDMIMQLGMSREKPGKDTLGKDITQARKINQGQAYESVKVITDSLEGDTIVSEELGKEGSRMDVEEEDERTEKVESSMKNKQTGDSPGKKSRETSRSPEKKSMETRGSPAKKTRETSRSPEKKTMVTRGSPAKKSRETSRSPEKKSMETRGSPAKKSRETSRSPEKKSMETRSSPAKKSRETSHSPEKKRMETRGSPAKKSRETSRSPEKKSMETRDSPGKKSREPSRSPEKKSMKTRGSPGKKTRETSRSPEKKSREPSGSPEKKSREPSRSPEKKSRETSDSPMIKSKQTSGSPDVEEVKSPAKPIEKEPLSPDEKQRKAAVIESEKITESGRATRRSRRLSLSEATTPQTPRRGRSLKSAENVGTPVTPTRRSRRLSGLDVQTEEQESGKKTPKSQTKLSSSKKTPARGTPGKSPRKPPQLDVSHVTLQLQPILEAVTENTEESNALTPEPRGKGGRRRHSSGGTSGAEQTPQKSVTPRLSTRRRTRLSTASEILETISENAIFSTEDVKESTKIEKTPGSVRSRGRAKKAVSSPEINEKAEEGSYLTPSRRKLVLPSSDKELKGNAGDAAKHQSTEKSKERSSSLSSGVSEITPPKHSSRRSAVSPHTSAKDTDSEEELRKEAEAAASRKVRTRRQSRRLSNILANPHAPSDDLGQVISTRTRRFSLAVKSHHSSDEGDLSGPSKRRSSHSEIPTDPSTVLIIKRSQRKSIRQSMADVEELVTDTLPEDIGETTEGALTEDYGEMQTEEASESPEAKVRLLEVVSKKKGNLMKKIMSRNRGRKQGRLRRLHSLRTHSVETNDEALKMESNEAEEKDSRTHSDSNKTEESKGLDDSIFPFEFSDPKSVLKEGKAISNIFEKLNTEAGAITEATEFVFSPPEVARKSSRSRQRSSRTSQEDKSESTTVRSLRKRRGR